MPKLGGKRQDALGVVNDLHVMRLGQTDPDAPALPADLDQQDANAMKRA